MSIIRIVFIAITIISGFGLFIVLKGIIYEKLVNKRKLRCNIYSNDTILTVGIASFVICGLLQLFLLLRDELSLNYILTTITLVSIVMTGLCAITTIITYNSSENKAFRKLENLEHIDIEIYHTKKKLLSEIKRFQGYIVEADTESDYYKFIINKIKKLEKMTEILDILSIEVSSKLSMRSVNNLSSSLGIIADGTVSDDAELKKLQSSLDYMQSLQSLDSETINNLMKKYV